MPDSPSRNDERVPPGGPGALEGPSVAEIFEHRDRIERAIADLRSTTRIKEPALRARLALNLGELAEAAMRRTEGASPKQSMRQLFERAFGAAFEANYKKRKRFIVLPDEKDRRDPNEPFCANGREFVELAEAIADMRVTPSRVSPADERMRACAALLRDTGLVRRASRIDCTEAHADILELASALVRKVGRHVDLDLLRERCRATPFAVSYRFPQNGKNGLWLAESGEETELPNYWARALDLPRPPWGDWRSPFAPSVYLGTLHTPTAVEFSGWLDISEERLALAGPDNAVVWALAEGVLGKAISAPDGLDFNDSDWWQQLCEICSDVDCNPNVFMVKAPAHIGSEFAWVLTARLGLEVQLRYDLVARDWCATFAVRERDGAPFINGFALDARLAGAPAGWVTGGTSTGSHEVAYAISPSTGSSRSRRALVALPMWPQGSEVRSEQCDHAAP